MKHISLIVLLLLFATNTQAQATISIPDTMCCPQDDVILPVYAENLHAGAISFFIAYDTTKMKFTSLKNIHQQLDGLIFHEQNGIVGIAWHSAAGIMLDNGRLFDLWLEYYQGTADIIFLEQSEIAGVNLSVLPVNLQHGTIQPSDSVSQTFHLHQGWNSFSLHVIPASSDPEKVFAPILAAIHQITDGAGIFYPQGNINTIGAIDPSKGYAIKTHSAVEFILSGCTASENAIQVPQGWTYLVVPVRCEVSVADLVASYSQEIRVVRSLIGTGVFWPEKDIASLDTLQPGKAYLINALTDFELVFPVCE
ncbi:MAG: hypothetical protein ACOCX8_01315 [Bacteroidota bacterium]